ncbi:MAG: dipeptide/oligopeptide/nickel ABC transporter ATP-binding protein [Bacillota bacterium]|nr:dipeptide/oligopeptide/nickel ABC transporter ATP-binding protein [Bacillota bacterium]
MPNNKNERDVVLNVGHLNMQFTFKRRGKVTTVNAVDDVTFRVFRGESFGLVGESGCGKTTTGRCLIRLYNLTSGKIELDGRDIMGKMTNEKRKYVTNRAAMIFQDPIDSLNPRMTVYEIISEGIMVRGMQDKDTIDRMAYDILDRVGLTREHASRYPHEFSGGQRIGIARALVIKTELVIADEPVSALDVSVQAQVINLLNDLKKEMGLTILFIAHNLSVVKYFSDRVGVMYKGKSEMTEVFPNHFVYASPTEVKRIQAGKTMCPGGERIMKYRNQLEYPSMGSEDFSVLFIRRAVSEADILFAPEVLAGDPGLPENEEILVLLKLGWPRKQSVKIPFGMR